MSENNFFAIIEVWITVMEQCCTANMPLLTAISTSGLGKDDSIRGGY